MATHQMNTILQHARRAALAQDNARLTDGQLLESFIAKRDEAPFEALLRRHGSMVLGVCYRILRNQHDAEDAFQATFLVFARKAAAVRPRERIANWLHGVAQRTALKARTIKVRTQLRERQVTPMPEPEAAQSDQWTDLQPVLDEELGKLPETYRLPILLCDVEGKSIKEATQQLGWPQGTLAGRLARARKLLAKRLCGRGIALSVGSLAVVLSAKAAPACVTPALVGSTVKAAVLIAAGQTAATSLISEHVAALMEGVLRGMLLTKSKSVTLVLTAVGIVALGGALLVRHTADAQQVQAEKVDQKPAIGQAVPPASPDEAKLHGGWLRDKGNDIVIFGPKNAIRRLTESGQDLKGTYSVDWTKKPLQLDLKWGEAPTHQAIMEFAEDGKLRIDGDKEGRPKEFTKNASVLTKLRVSESQPVEASAANDLGTADFYRRTGKFSSAHYYYELVRQRYPDTDFAKKATQSLSDLQKHRIILPDGSEGWASLEPQKHQPAPITIPQPAPKVIAPVPGKGTRTVIVENVKLVLEPNAKIRIDPVKTPKGPRIRLEITGDTDTVTVEAPKIKIEGEGEGKKTEIEATDDGKMRVREFPIAKRAAPTLRNILVQGNEKTSTATILKKLALYPGQTLDDQTVRTAERNLCAFNATVTIEATGDDGFADILIRVKEE